MSGSHLVTVEMVINDDAARAKLEGFLNAVGSNARLVAKDIDPWSKAVDKFSDRLMNMVLAGGSLYLVHRMVMATADAAQRTATALAGNAADAAEVSGARMSAYTAGWAQNQGKEPRLEFERRIDTTSKRLADKYGLFLADAYRTTGAALQSAVGMPSESVIGEGGTADIAASMAQRLDLQQKQVPYLATGINLVSRAWNENVKSGPRMTAKGAAAWLQGTKLAGLVESEEFTAKYIAPAIAQVSAVTSQPEAAAELVALLTSMGADTTGATTGTSAVNDAIGLLTSGSTPTGGRVKLKQEDGSETPFWDIIAQYKKDARQFVEQRGGVQEGRAALYKWLDKKFQGKSKNIAVLTSWFGTTMYDSMEADTREMIQVDPEGQIIDDMASTSRAGEFGNFGGVKQRITSTQNAVRNQAAEWGASPEGQTATALDTMLNAMPGLTAKERDWVKAAFFRQTAQGRNPYAVGAQILSNVSGRLLGKQGIDIGSDILQGNSGAFAIMSDPQRVDAARVLMGEAGRMQGYAAGAGAPLPDNQQLEIQALTGQAAAGTVDPHGVNGLLDQIPLYTGPGFAAGTAASMARGTEIGPIIPSLAPTATANQGSTKSRDAKQNKISMPDKLLLGGMASSLLGAAAVMAPEAAGLSVGAAATAAMPILVGAGAAAMGMGAGYTVEKAAFQAVDAIMPSFGRSAPSEAEMGAASLARAARHLERSASNVQGDDSRSIEFGR